MQQIIHYPRLDTLLRVEDFIQKHSGEFRKKQLWMKLPKKTMYQTFCVIIDYLLKCHKIMIDDQGKIVWIFNPALMEKLLKESVEA